MPGSRLLVECCLLLCNFGNWLVESVGIDYPVQTIDQHTGLQQYTGRAKRLTPSCARPIAPPVGERARWRRSQRGQKNRVFGNFPSHLGSKLHLSGVVVVITQKKVNKKNRTRMHETCADDVTTLLMVLVFAIARYKSL